MGAKTSFNPTLRTDLTKFFFFVGSAGGFLHPPLTRPRRIPGGPPVAVEGEIRMISPGFPRFLRVRECYWKGQLISTYFIFDLFREFFCLSLWRLFKNIQKISRTSETKTQHEDIIFSDFFSQPTFMSQNKKSQHWDFCFLSGPKKIPSISPCKKVTFPKSQQGPIFSLRAWNNSKDHLFSAKRYHV